MDNALYMELVRRGFIKERKKGMEATMKRSKETRFRPSDPSNKGKALREWRAKRGGGE